MKTILVIDDDESTRHVLSYLLAHWGYRALSAATADAALLTISTEKPDLIILDEMMPGMSGTQFLSRVRAVPTTSDLKVILYSAVDSPKLKTEGHRSGVIDFWLKGTVAPVEMRERLERLVPPAASDSAGPGNEDARHKVGTR